MLESVGLTPQAERVYAAMVRRPVAGVAALADELELSASEVQDAVHLLIERALIVPAGDGAWRAVGPQAALSALLAEQEAELANRHLRLETVRAWAAALEAEHDLGRPRDELVRLEGTAAVRERLDLVADSVREECLSFTVDREMSAEAIEAAKVNNLRVLRRGISMRNVYQETVRKDPDNLAFAKWMTEHGGPSRTVPTVPFRMLVVDRAVAFLAVNPADSREGALEIRSPAVVNALYVLFEQFWEAGTPFGESPKVEQDALSPQEQVLLRLLDAGHTDESAGRKLGLSARTVRRVIAELTDRMGVESRFQAGAEAVRRGWL
ncbi:helix-turn-helix transcriptional regulator [Catellatospora coxensis]|uniref:Transcriptional regulator n=1 Tax=Catellatospora coxensis TaxID=310354 RepID=A0A8J3PBW7_9ACTN|nr:LuxR family transcriptional regulator [Catellatospora coxensis]GIG11029.1 transcriptional regulator [Catellatospora coxensis]